MADAPYIGETIYYPVTKQTQILHGPKELINSAIDEYNKCDLKGKTCMKGAFGSVYKVSVDTKEYYVKYLYFNTKISFNKLNIYNEIGIAIQLTRSIPEYVSKLEASIVFEKEHEVSAYLIYEAPPGITLLEYLKNNNPTEKKNIPKYKSIYCSLKEAQEAINKAGYVHRDIKPSNIFVVHERSGIYRCKLIDFGLTTPIGTEGFTAGTKAYMPQSLRGKMMSRAKKSHNDHSVRTIWSVDFLFKDDPPNCLVAPGLPLPPVSESDNENENSHTEGGKRKATRHRRRVVRKTRRKNKN